MKPEKILIHHAMPSGKHLIGNSVIIYFIIMKAT